MQYYAKRLDLKNCKLDLTRRQDTVEQQGAPPPIPAFPPSLPPVLPIPPFTLPEVTCNEWQLWEAVDQ